MRVEVKPKLLRWACERARIDIQALSVRFPQLMLWEKGETQPTLNQIEHFAKAVHVPVGYLFLNEPPVEQLPIPDFRTIGNEYIQRPSPDLLETIYLCQQRQEWYRDFTISMKGTGCSFVGAASVTDSTMAVASDIRKTLGFDIEARRQMSTWQEALRHFIEQADELGLLVMVNGVVGSNNKRKLAPSEFRGFVLADKFAPLIFINGSDTKSAQMFTLAHELAHVWLGETGISDIEPFYVTNKTEEWCNQVAAELLAPLEIIHDEYKIKDDVNDEIVRLARYFKVSTLVIIRRIYDANFITKDEFKTIYYDELNRLMDMPRGSGGNFYLTQAARVGKRFSRALMISTLEGQTLHRDAFRLLGFSKFETFRELGHSLGVA
ncbi:MAG: hypothetical protein ACD_79C00201G0006 [uncultured bacterium]|nr:MAG: hypothetical protein ACD_79C00201G0006 [uncultured bacterium]